MLKYFLGISLIISVLLNMFLYSRNQRTGIPVIGVIDGDTIVLAGKTRVRLRYVDAPESGRCGSTQATKELERLTLGKKVRIDQLIPDQYGRGMALVYTGHLLINEEMVASGWVRYHEDTTEKTEEIKLISQAAKEQRRGVYALCQSTMNAKNPDCPIKGNIDKNKSSNNKKYYLPGCVQYPFTIVEEDMGEGWFCTEKEAHDAGFIKAETCT